MFKLLRKLRLNRPVITTAREALDALDIMLRTLPVEESRKVWDVLTALRGPDDEDPMMKEATTCLIRAAAFRKYMIPVLSNPFDATYLAQVRNGMKLGHGLRHFYRHATRAFEALGLTWTESNGLVTK